MPRRIIRNAIHLDALPATLTAAGKRTPATRTPATRTPATRKKPAKPATAATTHRPLPGETWEQRAARLREALFADLRAAGLAPWEPEYKFALKTHGRKWAFDLAWTAPETRIALEIEGRGSHQRGRYLSDMQKYNRAAAMGWLLLRVTYDMIEDGIALALVAEAHAYRQSQHAA
ncbi:MAG TPA: hypothetical protein VFN78_14145 [Ktedonobacterales bacterium]|nr:hypothetical protein [Ktedonobacterales bacterium]